jgi:hypothetical protein
MRIHHCINRVSIGDFHARDDRGHCVLENLVQRLATAWDPGAEEGESKARGVDESSRRAMFARDVQVRAVETLALAAFADRLEVVRVGRGAGLVLDMARFL